MPEICDDILFCTSETFHALETLVKQKRTDPKFPATNLMPSSPTTSTTLIITDYVNFKIYLLL